MKINVTREQITDLVMGVLFSAVGFFELVRSDTNWYAVIGCFALGAYNLYKWER